MRVVNPATRAALVALISIGTAHNAFPGSEFVRSKDAYFRPVWTECGPRLAASASGSERGRSSSRQRREWCWLAPGLRRWIAESAEATW